MVMKHKSYHRKNQVAEKECYQLTVAKEKKERKGGKEGKKEGKDQHCCLLCFDM